MTIDEVRSFALSLPETTEQPHHSRGSFRVRGKIFASFPADGTYLNVFVDEERRELAVSMFPEYCEKLWWGKKVVGVHVLLAEADAGEVEDLLQNAYQHKAPGQTPR